jgi:predicted transcriptional regulator
LTRYAHRYTLSDMAQKLVAVRMDTKAVKALEQIGKELDRKVSWLVRKAVDEYVDRHQAAKK